MAHVGTGGKGGRGRFRAGPARSYHAASAATAAAQIVRAGGRLAAAGLVVAAEGNLSVRLDGERVLVTPAGARKGELAPGDLVVVDMDGVVVDGDGAPSTELRLHLAVYSARGDVMAVVHAHPVTATGFAVAGEDLMAPVLPEIILGLGGVPLLEYAPSGSVDLADSVAAAARHHDGLLLANHGVVTVGHDLEQAVRRMECLEQAARSILTARLLGRVNQLDPEQTRALHALRETARDSRAATTVHATFVQEEAR